MKTKFYWVALLASAALIGQAQGGGNHGGGGVGGGFSGGGHVIGGGGPGWTSWRRFPWRWLPRSSPGVRWRAQILRSGSARRRSWLRHAVLSAACLPIMDELPGP